MPPKQNWINLLILCSLLIIGSKPTHAQITPDTTLGAEQSSLTPNVPIGTESADLIDGGAQRGSNLFHSFTEFNVNDGQRVYFANPVDVQNILTRVTGGQVSNILGTLGVNGSADLFLLNPNGIIFGPNAQLDLRGAFVGTTANAIGFGEQGVFNATNPESPPLLIVNPSVLLFNQLNQGSIVSNSLAPAGTSPTGRDLFGLSVPDGQSLLLVGGDVQIDGGASSAGLNAQGGRIELGGLASTGEIGFDNFRLTYPDNVVRSNVSLVNNARVNIRGNGGGDVVVNANAFTATDGGRLVAGTGGTDNAGDITVNASSVNFAGVASDGGISGLFNVVLESATGNGGNVIVNTNSFKASSGAQIDSSTLGSGNAGKVIINARDAVTLDGSVAIFSDVAPDAIGQGGDISITSGSLSLNNEAQLIAGTSGQGNSGNVIINTHDAVTLDNAAIFSDVAPDAIGQGGDISITSGSLSLNNEAQLIAGTGGDINITSGSLSLNNEAQLIAGTSGQGNSGNVIINTRDAVTLDDAAIFSNVDPDAIGQGGDISITTGVLSLTNGAELLTGTSGQGDAGDVSINARDINFQGSFLASDGEIIARGGILTRVEAGAIGKAGDVNITTGTLSLRDQASITASTRGQGNAGSIFIDASDRVSLKNSIGGISSGIEQNGVGQGGTIQIRTESLSLSDLFFISSSTNGQGDAGSIFIDAASLSMTRSDLALPFSGNITTNTTRQGNAGNITINVRDTLSINKGTISTNVLDSGLDDASFAGIGQGGDIRINSGSLQLTNDSQLFAASSGQGDAGNIVVNARDTVSVDSRSSIGTPLDSFNGSTAIGRAGDIQINARSLFLTDGGNLGSTTNAQGNAGKIDIRATDQVVLNGGSNNSFTAIGSAVLTDGVGQGGDIEITTGSLTLANNAVLLAGAGGQGNSGNVIVNARDRISLRNGSQLLTNMSGQGNAGNITIRTGDLLIDGVNPVDNRRSSIRSAVEEKGVGRAGNIDIAADSLAVTNGGIISGLTSGQGRAGDITIKAGERISVSGTSPNDQFRSAITTETGNTSTENAGNITLDTEQLSISDGAYILASTFGQGEAGNITVIAGDRVSLSGVSPNGQFRSAIASVTGSSGQGSSGNIFIDTARFNLDNQAEVSVASFGSGEGGQIQVRSQTLQLNDRSLISAQTETTNGGDITLSVDHSLLLRRGSLISTNAGTAEAGGNGGNITINANNSFLVAVPTENSDISANAYTGIGGNVRINAQGVFGIQARSQSTLESDITASSQLGVQGQITINQPNVQPTQGLIELPTDVLDASDQIAQVCPRGTAARPLGEFIVSGHDSLPPNPIEPLASTSNLSPLATLENLGSDRTSTQPSTPAPLTPPTQIVEAQGWVKTADGKIELVAQVPEATPHAATTAAACPVSKQRDRV